MLDQFVLTMRVGIDADWAKTNPARKLYHKSRQKGISIPLLFRQKGFDHARIRIRDYDLATVNPDTGMNLKDEIVRIVKDCIEAGLLPIVAFQAEDFKANPSLIERDRVVEWWKAMAWAIGNAIQGDTPCAYNFLIESTLAVRQDNAALNDLYRVVYEAVQTIDPQRPCIVCPSLASDPERLGWLQLPGEYCFSESHFAAGGFGKTNSEKPWTTGTAAEKQIITDKLDLMVEHRLRTARPVWFGAVMFGSTNDPVEPDEYSIAEQVEIAKFVMAEAAKRNIPIAINADDRYFDLLLCQWKAVQKPVLDVIVGV